jgi:succinate dehydrogenase / fumarate reductase iron-sulfur subunit
MPLAVACVCGALTNACGIDAPRDTIALMPTLELEIRRAEPDATLSPHFVRQSIVIGEKASVLDVLFAVQRGPLPDLAFRFSCRVGMCGSCALVVNGRERLACSTLAVPLGPRLRVEPLRNLPIVRDLVVDMAPLFEAYQRALPHFVPRSDLDDIYRLPQDGAEWRRMDHQPQCIDCGACYSSCTLVTLQPRYLGPMGLHRALSLIADPRDAAHAERLAIVGDESGVFRCHTLGNCRDACPRGISPATSIARLKRFSASSQVRAVLSRLVSKHD